ncbi:MAG: 3-isopropylmalate dehydratase [Bordetella sp. SCN 67-23]|nr:3-isopropylmalate dehydratase [Burkholderiales bacterium]ODS72466.1 MAG: 3-isopropylmalate dehydratase [Bordetella sp. SCN 67-23]ODU95659.1 MAG: 3-isopropylmalate dehydratase [Bordetella sp. SCN 68-11]OJW94836.1 MAG: 3-isopropylmalate dehydratase [Burkholderiales bacterium 67-32]
MSATTHRVWKLGQDIDTDLLAPGYVMKHGIDVIATHCLESVRPEFAATVRPGDVVAAGPGFGIGSSREQAAAALVRLGVAAVIAPSYGGLFFRNAFNVGLMLLTCPQAESLDEAAQIEIRFRETPQVATRDGRVLACEAIPDFLVDMARSGGLLNQLRKRLAGNGPGTSSTGHRSR